MDRKELHNVFGVFVVTILSITYAMAYGDQNDGKEPSNERGGVVWTWGGSIWGELGHSKARGGLLGGKNDPHKVSLVGSAIQVAAGYFHSMAIDTNGAVWTWGSNEGGELGIGAKRPSRLPVHVSSLEDVKAITGGQYFSIAVLRDGSVYTWGLNGRGELGNGTTDSKRTPVRVLDLDNVTTVDAGRNFAVALKNDGTVWAWGSNGYGQLGDGTNEDRLTPVRMKELEQIEAIACGDGMTIALKADGTVWGCGYNWYGNLGDGTETKRNIPVRVQGLDNVTAVSCGSNHTLAIRSDGAVWTWGYGYKGELGLGETFHGQQLTATKIPGLQDVKAVAGGWDYSLAVDNNGDLWAWGRNWNGQFGARKPRESRIPMKVPELSGIQRIDCGGHHTIAIRLLAIDLEKANNGDN